MGELYHTDFALWSAQQAEAIRSAGREHSNAPVDWGNVAEEIEDLGKSERRALASQIATIIEHLMKLQVSPAAEPRNGWRETIRRTRLDIERVLQDSPSLRRELPGMVADETAYARRVVEGAMLDRGEDVAGLGGLTFDVDRVLGPWMPD